MTVHLVLPNDIDDPTRPSGGNHYDRRLADGLRALGRAVTEHPVPGGWPHPDDAARARLAATLAGLPDGAPVIIDGLVASCSPGELAAHAGRLRLVVLVHMLLEHAAEAAALASAAAVVTTSRWCRDRLLSAYPLPPDRVRVATPGVDPAPLATPSPGGGRLLCVAAVTHHKGHDVLVEALAGLSSLSWSCAWAGSLDRDPPFAAAMRNLIRRRGLAGRLALLGARPQAEVPYGEADLLVLPSRHETFGMVVTEALARGVPVLASAAGGIPEALGPGGLLVPVADPRALGGALRTWLTSRDLRQRLREAARQRRATLAGWDTTAAVVAGVA